MSIGKPFFLVKLSCVDTNLTTSVVVQVGESRRYFDMERIESLYLFLLFDNQT